jgi:hypothetical protein
VSADDRGLCFFVDNNLNSSSQLTYQLLLQVSGLLLAVC